MPHISFDGPKLTKEQKSLLVKKLTEVSSETLQMPKEAINIIIRENELENVGVAGELLSEKFKK